MAQLTLDFHRSLAGTFALFGGRKPPENAYDVSFEGFLRSFGAMILVLPPLILVIMAQVEVITALSDEPLDTRTYWYLRLIMLPVEWFLAAALLALMTRAMNCDKAYVPFMIANNWASAVLIMPYTICGLLVIINVVSVELAPLLFLLITGFELFMRLRIARITLDIPGIKAVAIIGGWYIFSISLMQFTDSMFLS